MNNQSTCEHIRESIEEQILGRSIPERDRVQRHLGSCEACRSYATELEKLYEVSGIEHSLPQHEQVRFSAMVRTRIEEKKTTKSERGIFARPAFQIAAMLVIVLSVILYMSNTEPEPVFVFDEEELEVIDTYSLYYDDIVPLDDDLITELYTDLLFGDDFYLEGDRYSAYFEEDFYYELDELTPEEIDFIIQRLEGVYL